MEVFLSAFVANLVGLLITRKRGPFNIFSLVKKSRLLYPVLRCEVCTTAWAAMATRVSLGIIPSWRFVVEVLASAGLGLALASITDVFVPRDSDGSPS